MFKQILTALVFSVIGFVAGWYSRTPPAPVASEVPLADLAIQQIKEPETLKDKSTVDDFARSIEFVKTQIAAERYLQAYDLLIDIAPLAARQVQEEEFKQVLAQLADLFTRELIALRQMEAIDEFYEKLSYDYPQYAEYQFRLGKIRVQMGNYGDALPPLAQVINHPQFGAEARALMAQIENSQLELTATELPLMGSNGQFIVEAEIDGGIRVNLLVDTGAAITAIDRGVLQQAGYDLNAEPQYFATANGVVAAPVLTLAELKLGDARVNNLSVGALSLSMPGNVVGLLGMNFLRHYDFRIDQTRRVLILDQR